MDHSYRIIERLVIHYESRMSRALEDLHKLADRDLALNRDYICTWNHNVCDPSLAQGQYVPQHDALGRRKASLAFAIFKQALEAGAGAACLPAKHRSQQTCEPTVGA